MEGILIVEDEILIGVNIKQMAEDLGYEVYKVAGDVQAARQVAGGEDSAAYFNGHQVRGGRRRICIDF